MLVFGTRPEAIKMCPLVNELKSRPDEFQTIVAVTGQHREMLDQVLSVFDVAPDHDLAIMKPGQTLFDVTCDVLLKLKAILEEERPDVVLVHGDTTTSFAAALACFYLQIPVGHVEAGLRTHDIYSPWPEEFNRQAVDIVTEYYFAPTEASKQNLLEEGKPANIVPKIVEGRLNAFFKDNCLVDQAYARDPSKSVGQVLKEAGATVTNFVRVHVGA